MKYLILFALCVAVTQAYSVGDWKVPKKTVVPTGGRIFYGEDAVNGQFPHMVTFQYGDWYGPWCGGALIDAKWVISAAHCFPNPTDGKPLAALLGDVNWSLAPVSVKVIKINHHPQYAVSGLAYDIALLELEKAVRFTANIKKIRIPRTQSQLFEGEIAMISGYGWTEQQDYPDVLRFVRQKTLGPKACMANHICTEGYPTAQQDICDGDSGGPLIVKRPGGDILIGVLSAGSGECDGAFLAGFVRPNFVLKWIRDTTGLPFN